MYSCYFFSFFFRMGGYDSYSVHTIVDVCMRICVSLTAISLSHTADSAPTFTIQNRHFQEGTNTLDITVSHNDCSQPGTLQLEFPYQTPPQTSASPDVSCSVGQQDNNIVFTCTSTSLTITRISYFVNDVPVGTSSEWRGAN